MNTEQAMQVLATKLAAVNGDQTLVINWLNNVASVDMLMDLAVAVGAKLGGAEIMAAYLQQVPVYFVSLLLPDMPDHKVCRHERVSLVAAAPAQAVVDRWNDQLWQGALDAQGYDINGYFEVGNLASPEKYYTHPDKHGAFFDTACKKPY